MSQVKVFGVPYEGKENFQKGTFLAPSFIRYHLSSLEYYSTIQSKDMKSFEDLSDFYPPLDVSGKEFMDFLIERLRAFDIRPPFIALGGDHFITLPLVKYLKEIGFDFKVVHFDAHMDRREEFEGEKYNHATVMHHVEGIVGQENIISVGIRAKAPCEKKEKNIFYAWEDYSSILKKLSVPVYLSLDLDVINPAEFPGVTNPEPGGPSLFEVVEDVLSLKHIIAADIVEFSPLVDSSTHSGVAAAFIFRELLIKLQNG